MQKNHFIREETARSVFPEIKVSGWNRHFHPGRDCMEFPNCGFVLDASLK
jgi:hypothetical protein